MDLYRYILIYMRGVKYMTTVAQRKASAKYDKAHTRSVLFKFNTTTDADILAKLDEVGNKQGYIKELIRENIGGKEDILPIDSIRLMILPIVRKYDVSRVVLFGSYARGEATCGSDVDLLIECNSIRNMNDYLGLQEGLEKVLGKNVDLIMADALQSDTTRSAKRLIDNIERDKVIVYERNQ